MLLAMAASFTLIVWAFRLNTPRSIARKTKMSR